jgi:hypothetical protein
MFITYMFAQSNARDFLSIQKHLISDHQNIVYSMHGHYYHKK